MDIKEFKENWGLMAIPTEIEKLIYFQKNLSSFGEYTDGFGILVDDKTGLKTWSENPSFLDNLFPFAQANCSGSFYAIWNNGTGKPLNEMPIVVFGDEGGVHIVAENMVQLLHLLTFDSEIFVDFDEVFFYKNEKAYRESEDLEAFLKWLKGDYKLDQIQEPSVIINVAQNKYKDSFDKWLGQYFETE